MFRRWWGPVACAIVAPMNKPLRTWSLALPLALLFATGAAHAQLKAPTPTSPSREGLGGGLGSGLGAPAQPVTPSPAATPVPTAPAASAPAPAAAAPGKGLTGDEIVQEIANCVLAGLPPDWKLAQVEVREIGRSDTQREFEAFYSFKDAAGKSAAFTPCDQREPALNVYKLNGALEPAKRNWARATLVLSSEGKFELSYDYLGKEGDKPAAEAKPGAADAKKSAKKDAPKKK